MNDWSLADLLHPISLERFSDEYWQKKVLHVTRNDHGAYRELVDSTVVEHLIATHGGRHNFPISILGGFRADAKHKVDIPPGRSHWTADRVFRSFSGGATIRIGNTSDYVPAIKRLATHFEAELNSDIGVNLYLTPPQAHAFGAHFDKHDIFVLQVEGAKTWRIFSPPDELPLEVVHLGRTAWVEKLPPGEGLATPLPSATSVQEFHLQPGDLLYVPRGYVHQVFTEGERSLHLTVAALAVTWYEVAAQALLAVARRSPSLREALPIGFATSPNAQEQARGSADHVIQTLHQQLSAGDLCLALQEMTQQFAYSRKIDWRGLSYDVARIHQITPDTCLKIRSPLVYTTRKNATHISLLFSQCAVELPIRVESMLEYILQNKIFKVAELPTILSDESRLVLARELTTRGFLSFADDARTS